MLALAVLVPGASKIKLKNVNKKRMATARKLIFLEFLKASIADLITLLYCKKKCPLSAQTTLMSKMEDVFLFRELVMYNTIFPRLQVNTFQTSSFIKVILTLTAKTQYRKFETNIPRKGIARPQSQFPHSGVSEQFIYPTIGLPVCCRKICGPILGMYKSLTDTLMWKLGLFWEYINGIFITV
jgi:hypothetical protein